ncbi:hypothetical protein [Acidianus hospitalis]|uniref:hypothetical protein n=1 Tax=Acidianus hospitalis TaxID=563177 RepID=UPI00064F08A5|nr:hypothetical protein [Acidianus hospitalis]
MIELDRLNIITVVGKISYISKLNGYVVVFPYKYKEIIDAVAPVVPRTFFVTVYLDGEKYVIGKRNIYKNTGRNYLLVLPSALKSVWERYHRQNVIVLLEKVEVTQ